MTLLAVLDSTEQPSEFSVPELHFNLWSLAAIGGRRRSFVLDVGVLIQAESSDVDTIAIGVPFATDEFESLHAKLADSATAGLIFNSNVTVAQHSIDFGGGTLWQVHEVAVGGSAKQKPYSDAYFSLWELKLATPIRAGSMGYVRVRFPITGAGKAWEWQRQRLFRSGATIDLRVSDGRSAQQVKDGSQLIGRMRPVEKLSGFVMVPAWMHGRTIAPTPHYIRLLEGNLWRSYLDRNPEWRRRSRLIVYYWKHSGIDSEGERDSITHDKPFQIFADFGMDSHPSRVLTILASSFVSILGIGAVYALPVQTWALDTGAWIARTWTDFFSANWSISNPISLTIAIAILITSAWKFANSSWSAANKLRATFLKAEANLLRMLSARR